MKYETAAAFRVALDRRLANRSRETGVDLNRLRRRVAFERLLVRLESAQPGRWIVKGGMALEVRWPDRARATRDLDLAVAGDIKEVEPLRRLLGAALSSDPQRDWFQFLLGSARSLAGDERPGWRIPLEAALAGRRFANVIVDVVTRWDEITRTERVPFPGSLSFAGLDATEVETIDRNQHFAEKLHALTRSYFGRPNSRVKDLPDLLMLIEDGLLPTHQLLDTVRHVFAVRATHDLPRELDDPPSEWAARYEELSEDLDIGAKTVAEAMARLRAFWREMISPPK